MTSTDPSDRDELVAAYLDGEATPEERALVEGDPDLMERAQVLRQVADLIAEPVLLPVPELRNSHIAAALATSSTAANVTSLATKRRRWSPDYAAVLGAAAVIIVVLFAGTLLLTNVGGDDDDTAAGGVNDTATEEFDVFDAEGADEQEALATTDGGEAASSAADSGGDDTADMVEAAQIPEEGLEEAATEEEMADEAAEEEHEEEAAAAESDDAASAVDTDDGAGAGPISRVARDVEPALTAPTIEVFASLVGRMLNHAGSGGELVLGCDVALDDLSRGFLDPVIAGEGTIAGLPVEYVVLDDFGELLLIVVDADTCALLEETPLP